MPILKLDRDDEEKKIEFELNYLLSLTVRQRFSAMLKKSEEIRNLLKGRGNRKTVEIIKRS
jgi:hypothetical protein